METAELVPGHCYPTTKAAGWARQTRKWEQTEIRDGYEEASSTAWVPRHSLRQLAGPFHWISHCCVRSCHELRSRNVSKHRSSYERLACVENLPRQLSEEALMKMYHGTTQVNSVIKQNSGVTLISDWWVGHLSTSWQQHMDHNTLLTLALPTEKIAASSQDGKLPQSQRDV